MNRHQSPEERHQLISLLESEMRGEKEHKIVEELVAEQGTRPLSFEELLGEPGSADDENVDDFLAELERWRSHQSSRRLN